MAPAPGTPRLLAFIGHNDADILPFFLEHYRALGISGFKLALHGAWPEAALDWLTSKEDVAVWDLLSDSYEDSYRRSVLNLMAEDERGRWVAIVDADEFLELPFGTIGRTIDALEVMGQAALPSFLLQRVSGDGRLPALDPDQPIERQFPKGHFGLCEEMRTERPVWKTKYPLAKVTADFKVERGNHWPPVRGAQAHLPVRGVLHHFKWRQALKAAFELYRGPTSNDDEMASYRRWLAAHDDRLPIAKAWPVSRQELFDRGLLVKPTRRQLLLGSLQRKLRARKGGREDRRERLGSQLDLIGQSLSGGWGPSEGSPDADARSMTELRHLCLPPGRICLVTFDLTPPLTSGGIGTAMAALADHLSEAGHDVHLLFCPYEGPPELWRLWYDLFDNRGVTLHYMPRVEGEKQHYLPQGRFLSKLTRFLQDHQFDIVHVADAAGYGQAFAILRAASLESSRTRLVVTAHGGIAWHRRGNHLPWTRDEAEATFAEEQMLRLADIVCCPSAHMRDHLLEKGAISPERSIVLPNILSHLARSYGEEDRPARTVKEFVMIGRIERRKGITRFAEAIRMLQSAGRFEFDVTFLGTKGPGIELDDIRAMLGAKGATARFIDGFAPLDVINYLRTRDCLVVVPSLRENLPYAVYECLENGIPLLASDVGGIPELVDQRDRERLLIASDPRMLADAMAKALSGSQEPGRLAFDPGEVALRHLALHAKLVDEAKRPARSVGEAVPFRPSVACLIYGRGKISEEAEERRREALPRDFCIVESGEDVGFDAWASDPNTAIEQSSADWLFLCHALAVPEPGALAAMTDLLAVSCADAVVTGYKLALVDGEAAGPSDPLLAPGGPAVFAPSWNLFGIGVVLMPRTRFLELGGFRGDGIADRFAHWDLLNRLLAKEGKVFGIPKELATGYVHDADELRSCLTSSLAEALLAPWLERTPSHMHGFLRNSVGETFGDCPELKRAEDWLLHAADQPRQTGFGAGMS